MIREYIVSHQQELAISAAQWRSLTAKQTAQSQRRLAERLQRQHEAIEELRESQETMRKHNASQDVVSDLMPAFVEYMSDVFRGNLERDQAALVEHGTRRHAGRNRGPVGVAVVVVPRKVLTDEEREHVPLA